MSWSEERRRLNEEIAGLINERDAVLYEIDELRAEVKSGRTITQDEFKAAVLTARNAYGDAIEKGNFSTKFSRTLRAVLDQLGFEVERNA